MRQSFWRSNGRRRFGHQRPSGGWPICFAMGLLMAVSAACAQNSMEEIDAAINQLERAKAEGPAKACEQAKVKCLAAIDKAVQHRRRELRALQAKVGSDASQDHSPNTILARSIVVLEQELADLSAKEETARAAACDQLD